MMRWFYFFLLTGLWACSAERSRIKGLGEGAERTVVVDELSYHESWILDSLVYDVKQIPLEATEECSVRNYSEICILDEYIYILDKKSYAVFRFDLNGKYVDKLSEYGYGPGQYQDIQDFYIDTVTNDIVVLDGLTNSLMIYELGTFNFKEKLDILSKKYPPVRIARVGESIALMLNNECAYSLGQCYNFNVVDYDGELRFRALKVPSQLKNNPYEKPQFFSSNGESLYINQLLCDTIYRYSESTGLQAEYALNFGEYALPAEVFDRSKIDMMDLIYSHCVKDDKTWGVEFFSVSSTMLYFQFVMGGSSYHVFYDPSTDAGIRFKNYRSHKYFLSSVRSSWKDYFVCLNSAKGLSEFKRNYQRMDEKNKVKYVEMYEFANKVEQGGNHVVTLFKIKDL